jgi:hypothetical protein
MWKSVAKETKMMRYEASKTGGLVRSVRKKTGVKRILSNHNSHGYVNVNISDYGTVGVHQLVAEAHVPKPESWNETWTPDHKDNDKKNNDAENLEWASPSMQSFNRRSNSRGNIDSCPVVGIHIHTGRIVKFESATVAEAHFKFVNDVESYYETAVERFDCSYKVGESNRILHCGISMCLTGKRNTHGNYVWTTPLELQDLSDETWIDSGSKNPKYSMSVSNDGRTRYEFKSGYNKKVYSHERMSERLTEETDRYPCIVVNDVPYQFHCFIWEKFMGPIPGGMIVHHKNHDKQDARLSNLELITRCENTTAAYDAGRFDGNKNERKKMSIDGVEYESEKQASEKLGISRATISKRLNDDRFPMYILINS